MKKVFLSVLILAIMSAMASADDSTVVVVGHATLKQRPEILRLKVTLSVQGDDSQGAITALSQRRDSLKKEMIALGAKEDSISFSEPTGAAQLTPQQRQMQMILEAQGKKPTTQGSGVNVSCDLSAEWPIQASSADEAFVISGDLEQKIKAAVAAGAAKKPKTPEEQEISEEMAGADQSQAGAKSDEPAFVFVHKLTDAEQADLDKRAVADAMAQAQQLATAAGKTVGAVKQISMSGASSDAAQNPYMDYIESMTGANNGPAKPDEASGNVPGSVTANAAIQVTFELH
jgi:uncharacterized protein YggE